MNQVKIFWFRHSCIMTISLSFPHSFHNCKGIKNKRRVIIFVRFGFIKKNNQIKFIF